MSQSVRKWIFREHSDWVRFVEFMRTNMKDAAEHERPLQAVVSHYKATRSAEQNAFMWVGILEPLAMQASVGGTRFKAEVWNELLKELFLPETCAKGIDKWLMLPNGERRLEMSTSDLNVEEMTLYLNQAAAYAASEQGVMLPVNPRDL